MSSCSLITALISAFSLLSVASALPSSTRTTELQTRDCPVNTWYSKCGDISGCFNYDPCNIPTCTPGTTGNSTGLSMYVVLPGEPDVATPPFPYFQVQSGQADINAVGVFTGIPAAATTCTVYWRQGVPRVFSVQGSGYVAVQQLGGLDTAAAGGVSWGAVEHATDLGEVGGAAMGNWDAPGYGAVEHKVGSAKGCAEQMAMLFTVDKDAAGADATDNTYLELDDNNGWFIKYTC